VANFATESRRRSLSPIERNDKVADQKDSPSQGEDGEKRKPESAKAVAEIVTYPKRYASSTDVARLAGVSQSAVSRTFKPGASVSEVTRRKVLAAAEALGYRPSLIPRIMLTHRSSLVAIVVGGMYNPFYAMMLEQFLVSLQKAGKQALLVHVNSGHSLEPIVPKLASYRVDAIVSALSILSERSADHLAQLKIPVVSFNTPITNAWVSSVCCDNFGAGRVIASLFIARGARRFGYLAGAKGSPASVDRFAGYSSVIAEAGLGEVRVGAADFSYDRGYQATLEMFERPHPPDALFCANDLSAFGAIDALHKLGLGVPSDVVVCGFDNILSASWGAYELTTFLQDGQRMVAETLKLIESRAVAEAPSTGVSVVVPAVLIERTTTGHGARVKPTA
jgi:DNA-binding LacI/PurR family transcriptional regulator